MNVFNMNAAELWPAVEKLGRDAVLVTPTDTVYGFSARVESEAGIRRIRDMKGLAQSRFIVLVRSAEEAESLVAPRPDLLELAAKYWPGPFTFIFPSRREGVTIAVRLPDNPFLIRLMDALGGPIVSTSCNVHGLPTVQDIPDAVCQFGKGVDLYVDGGTVHHHVPSTLVDLADGPPRVVRMGAGKFP